MRHTKNINVRQYQADWFGSKNGLNNTPLLRSITRKKSIKKVSDFLLYPRIKRGFSTRGSTCAAIAFYISPPPFSLSSRFFLFPFSLTFFPPEPPPPPPPSRGCDRSHSLICCIAFTGGHKNTAENLCRYSRPFYRVCPQSPVSKKMTSGSEFRYAGRRPAVTHPSTDPAPSGLTWVTAWCRTPTTHLPRTRTLLVYRQCSVRN